MQDLNTWLDQVVEETLEPELPIIDPHHHLWDRPNSPYLLKDIARDVSTHIYVKPFLSNVVKCIQTATILICVLSEKLNLHHK